MSSEKNDVLRNQGLQGARPQDATTKPVWRRPTITRIDMKDTMSGSITQGLIVHVH